MDSETGKYGLQTDDPSIQSAEDLVRLEDEEENRIRGKFGRMGRKLIEKFDNLNDSDKIRVEVALKRQPGIVYLSKFDHSEEELRGNSLEIAGAKPERSMANVLASRNLSRGTFLSEFSEIILVNKSQLKELAFDANVASIEEFKAANLTLSTIPFLPALFQISVTENVITLARSAYNHSQASLPSGLAVGINAATFESGLENSFVACLNLSPAVTWDGYLYNDTNYQSHSLTTFTNLVNAAPGATFFHRAGLTVIGTDAYITANSLNVISISFGGNSSTFIPSMTIDDWSYRWPYPTFVTATGNDGLPLVPDWYASYNQLSVGNVQDSNYTHFSINDQSGCGVASETKNPPPIKGSCISGSGANCPGDREMPYLVAPGWAPRARIAGSCALGTQTLTGTTTSYPIWMKGSCVPTMGSIYDDLKWGTSMSAPTVAGIVADIMGGAALTKGDPELIRAIVLLTARNVTGGYWQSTVDGVDGAGVIHGSDARAFAQTMTSVSPNGAAVEKGYSYMTFSQSDFQPNNINRTYNVKIPSAIPAGKHLRLVLTWDSSTDLVNNLNDLSDIDLQFNASSLPYYSSSYDGNIEIIDVTGGVTAGATYQCVIKPFAWRQHSGATYPSIYAALTWGFVADHAH